MAPCLEGPLNTAPLAKAPERKNEGEISDWAHPGLQHRANTKANPHLSMKIPPLHVCSVCVCESTCILCVWGDEEHVCAKKVLAKSTAAFISDAWFHSIWSIYPENEQPTSFFFSPRGFFLWHHRSFTFLSLFQFSLSHNFFQSCCLTLPSSLKLCRGHNLEL